MSKISFITFCVEYYAEHIGKTGAEVYELFKKEGVLDLLENDYEDLHGMGMEYLMQMIGEYLGSAQCRGEIHTSHTKVRTVNLPEIVKLIASHYHVSEKEALDQFYSSATGASFGDDETGLYGQSALYLFGLFKEEHDDMLLVADKLDIFSK